MEQAIEDIRQILEELKEEEIPKILLGQIELLETVINESIDIELRLDRMRSILDEIDQMQNIPNHVRTQFWNLNAMLEFVR